MQAVGSAVWLALALALGHEPVIVIDPGHGGSQQGALGAGRFWEKDLALVLARKVRDELKRRMPAKVLLTRERDGLLHLSERVSYANARRPDLFLSLHANSMPTPRLKARAEGLEVFFLSADASGDEARRTAARENAEGGPSPASSRGALAFILADLQRAEAHVDSARLAYALHQKLVEATGAVDRGVQQAPFFVLMGVEAPAVLIEVGFISHPVEGRRLQEPAYQDRLARAIADGAAAFLAQTGERDLK